MATARVRRSFQLAYLAAVSGLAGALILLAYLACRLPVLGDAAEGPVGWALLGTFDALARPLDDRSSGAGGRGPP